LRLRGRHVHRRLHGRGLCEHFSGHGQKNGARGKAYSQ
jgi:hypothetical protein